jgi:undecaprenyl diphosphate synthase
VVRRIVTEAARLGLDALTLYSFSIENWSRPKEEVNALMHLYAEYLVHERQTVMDHNIRLRHLGRRDGLPENVLKELDESVSASSVNDGMYLCLALNYSSRAEITDAVRRHRRAQTWRAGRATRFLRKVFLPLARPAPFAAEPPAAPFTSAPTPARPRRRSRST